MSHNAFACIASLFEAGLDRRARCSDGGEQDKSYAGKKRGRLGREPGNLPFASLVSSRFFFPRQLLARTLLSEHLEQANPH